MILRDRLYRSRASQQCLQVLGSAPPFPFTQVPVKKSQPARGTQQISSNSRSGAAYSNNSQTNVQQAQAYQSSMHNGTISAAAPAVVSVFDYSIGPVVVLYSSNPCLSPQPGSSPPRWLDGPSRSHKWENILCQSVYWRNYMGSANWNCCCTKSEF
jgi:hypothetical protein